MSLVNNGGRIALPAIRLDCFNRWAVRQPAVFSPVDANSCLPSMLHLKNISSERWLAQVGQGLDEILIDHAHCERKAATTALSLLNAYTEDFELGKEMTRIVEEELEHYWMVLSVLQRRGIPFRRLQSSPYGRRLNELVRTGEPFRAIDRLIIAGLIEARSCERFRLLSDHMRTRDEELSVFYSKLFESEARHHATYLRLAENFTQGDRQSVRTRLAELSEAEAQIIADGGERPRMHS